MDPAQITSSTAHTHSLTSQHSLLTNFRGHYFSFNTCRQWYPCTEVHYKDFKMLHYCCHTLHIPNYKVQSKTLLVHSSMGSTYSSQQLIAQGDINPTLNKPMYAQSRSQKKSTQTISGVLVKKKKNVKILYKILFCEQASWHLLWTINLYLLIIHVAIAITQWMSCMTCHCSGLKHSWSCFSQTNCKYFHSYSIY